MTCARERRAQRDTSRKEQDKRNRQGTRNET